MTDATRIRVSPIDGPELRCAHCGDWWPITPECWRPAKFSMCALCIRERDRLYAALRRLDPEFRASETRRTGRYRNALRRAHPEYIRAYDRELQARRRDRMRAYRERMAA